MLYKMIAPNSFKGDAIEYTYNENVQVKKGISLCRLSTTKDALFLRGYSLLEELPLNVDLGDRISEDLYVEEKYQPRQNLQTNGKRNKQTVHKDSTSKETD